MCYPSLPEKEIVLKIEVPVKSVMSLTRKLLGAVNSKQWRGYPPRSVMFVNAAYDRNTKMPELGIMEVRLEPCTPNPAPGVSFPTYREADFGVLDLFREVADTGKAGHERPYVP